jgi:ankyrin repeat protein
MRRADGLSSGLATLMRAIARRDGGEVLRILDASPALVVQALEVGATRQASTDYFFNEIAHYVYGGDTALHVAAAAYEREIAEALLARGASVSARNRRGAEPLHYAADGIPGSPTWNPAAQEAIVRCLIEAGADPNAADKSGVTPLHRAVRTRCTSAVKMLLALGADVRRPNSRGSTPLDLAIGNTGRGGSGSEAAKKEQRKIIELLRSHRA